MKKRSVAGCIVIEGKSKKSFFIFRDGILLGLVERRGLQKFVLNGSNYDRLHMAVRDLVRKENQDGSGS